jgi:dipeptidyl aminopeptidase/acylaminoacyl peptidase
MFDDPVFRFVGFHPEKPNIIYVASNHESDRTAVYEFDLGSKSFGKKLFEHPAVDVGTWLCRDREPLYFSRARRKLLSIGYVVDRRQLHFLDDDFQQHMQAIDRALPGRVNRVTSRNKPEDRWIIESGSDAHAPATYLYSTGTRKLRKLFDSYPDLEPGILAPMKPISFEARDGWTIRGYLTVPNGVPSENLPVVLLVHGGPACRDIQAFDREVQFLANRGYAVLQINFRGSIGFGSRFWTAGWGRWGLEMQDDLTDGVRWLVEQGIADPDRIAIYGGSYGGYASLMAVVKEPTLFRCAAALAGVFDLREQLGDEAWRGWDHSMARIIGDPSKRNQLIATSPALHAEKIQVPVLVAHGERDWRVNPEQSEQMAEALRRAGKPHELLLMEDEPHGLQIEETRLEFYQALEAFLEKNLAPREKPEAEPAAGG